jgi:hypothetical protein
MAEAVVDILEIVEIDEGDGRPSVVPLRELDRSRQALFQQGAVGEPGERVMGRHELNPVFRQLAFDGDASDLGRGVGQPHFRCARLAD